MKLYIAEKPSMGRVLAQALGGGRNQSGHIAGSGWVVTWCFGHLFGMKMPEDYNQRFKRWSRADLPIIPQRFELKPRQDASAQIGVIRRLLKGATTVVNAGDPDREGQLLVDEVLVELKCTQPVDRLWLPALDSRTVNKALRSMRPNQHYETTYHAALARSRADWLVGLNLTRAYTVRAGRTLTVGRVQTPTLKLVVDRDREIENFVPKDYFVLKVVFRHARGEYTGVWNPTQSGWIKGQQNPDRLVDEERRCLDRKAAEAVLAGVVSQAGAVQRATGDKQRESAPLPFTLSDLQSEASRRFSMGAQQTLNVAQSLYEKHKAISYPRTDCRYLSDGQFSEVSPTFKAIANADPAFAPSLQRADTSRKPRAFQDKRVTAHTAIVPTPHESLRLGALSPDERKIYDLVRRRYVAQFYPDFVYHQLIVATRVGEELFDSRAKAIIDFGWRELENSPAWLEQQRKGDSLPAGITQGDPVTALKGEIEDKKTTPPSHYTEGTLIKTMANIARIVDDPAAKKCLREASGIGTEATRASIIENLKKRGFLDCRGKFLISTPSARELIDKVSPELADPVVTARWEDTMRDIEAGKATLDAFLKGIHRWVGQLVTESDKATFAPPPPGSKTRFSKGNKKHPPTKKMIQFAKTLATRKGLKRLPRGVASDFDTCRAFLDANAPSTKAAQPNKTTPV